eukprot:m.247694 g.247694  ORF g.247694 m.247694 type:complete len:294 (+) comp26461_c0_seq1:224-1105(+)
MGSTQSPQLALPQPASPTPTMIGECGRVVLLPCHRILQAAAVDAAVAAVPRGGGMVELRVHSGTRGYGDHCFAGPMKMRVGAVVIQASSPVRWQMLRRLIVVVALYEPNLLRKIRGMLPKESEVATVGKRAFDQCHNLTLVTIPGTVTSIGDSAFIGCSGLTTMSIPNAVTSISLGAFFNCAGLKSVVVPESVTTIGVSAFSGCTGLTLVTIPDSVTTIGRYAFYGCSGLTSMVIPDSVTSIGDSAFYRCSGLTSMVVPDSVISIGDSAFAGCAGLTSLTRPTPRQGSAYWPD